MNSHFPSVLFQRDALGRAIAQGVHVGIDVHLGNNITVYPAVHIGDRTIVMDGAVLGRIPIASKTTTRPVRSTFFDLTIGPNSIIGCNVILYTGSKVGSDVLIGDLTSIREDCVIGNGVVIGRGVMVLYECIIGSFSRIQDQAHLVGNMVIEEHVFIGMGVVTTNDNDIYRSRFGLVAPRLKGPVIRKFAVVGAGVTILPGVEIGEGSMVAAGAVVTQDVPAWTLVAGVPAKHVKNIPDDWRQQIESMHSIEQC